MNRSEITWLQILRIGKAATRLEDVTTALSKTATRLEDAAMALSKIASRLEEIKYEKEAPTGRKD